MDMSFYSAAAGASAHQAKLDVVANNIANANTYGYKAKTSTFSDLMYNKMNSSGGEAKTGSGTKLDKSDTVFSEGSLFLSDSSLDFSIDGRGFFGLLNPETKEVEYTANGNFVMSKLGEKFYLASKDGYFVLGKDGKPIEITGQEGEKLEPAVYDFPINDGVICVGDTNFIPTDKNGAPQMIDANVRKSSLETSNVDLAHEMTKVIEAQRAYQYSLKMIQTSDEIQQLINTLR